jgi:hypothetical protein
MVGKIYLSAAAGARYGGKRLSADASVCGLQWPLININVCVCVNVWVQLPPTHLVGAY